MNANYFNSDGGASFAPEGLNWVYGRMYAAACIEKPLMSGTTNAMSR
jgi:hypothetical protein